MKYYAVIDTNVIVSTFLKKGSVPEQITSYVWEGKIVPIVNDEILKEYREVLLRPKFHFNQDTVETFVLDFAQRSIFLNGWETDILLPDPKDVVFYAVVMEARTEQDTYLVTGNIKHFPKEMFVVTPREMLALVKTGKLPSRE